MASVTRVRSAIHATPHFYRIRRWIGAVLGVLPGRRRRASVQGDAAVSDWAGEEFLPALSRGVSLRTSVGTTAVASASPPSSSGSAARSGGPAPLTAIDQRLVQAIRRGDSVAAAPLYAFLRPGIERTLYRVLRHRPAEFEDLLQVTYERVIRTIAAGNFEGRSQLKTWASAIAANVATDYLRRRNYELRLFEGLGAGALAPAQLASSIERQIEARSEVRKVQGILRRMKPRYAALLVLHDLLGHSVPQVAELLDMNAAAARSTLRRARQEFARRCTPTSRPVSD